MAKRMHKRLLGDMLMRRGRNPEVVQAAQIDDTGALLIRVRRSMANFDEQLERSRQLARDARCRLEEPRRKEPTVSKAFTRDEDSASEVVVRPIVQTGAPRPITPEGHAQLSSGRASLEARRLELKSQGTTDAAAALRDVEARLRQLNALLDQLEPRPTSPDPDGRAVFGAWVRVEDEAGEGTTWRLVGPDEADARAKKLSVQSPLGRALLGKRAGDRFVFERPRGETLLTVVEVTCSP